MHNRRPKTSHSGCLHNGKPNGYASVLLAWFCAHICYVPVKVTAAGKTSMVNICGRNTIEHFSYKFPYNNPCLKEIDKLCPIASSRSKVERLTAAKILCGASLIHGQHIQEHMVHYVVELPASPKPRGHSGTWGLLVGNLPMLSDVLREISGVDIVHIFPLHGVVPKFCRPVHYWSMNYSRELGTSFVSTQWLRYVFSR